MQSFIQCLSMTLESASYRNNKRTISMLQDYISLVQSHLLKQSYSNLLIFGQEGKPGIARLIFPSSISWRRFFIHCLRFWLLVSQNCCGNFSSTPLITAIANSKQHKSTSYKTIENFKTHAPFAYHVNDLKMCRLYFVQKDRWYSNKIQDSGCTSYSCVFRRWRRSSSVF